MGQPGDVTVINTVSTQGGANLPTSRATENLGGFREAADLTARDAIPVSFRTEGMHVYVVSNDTTYRLGAGLTNLDWVVASASGATITGDHAAFENPTTLQEWIDFADPLWRPEYNAPSVHGALGGNIYVGDWSAHGGTPGTPSDTTGNGSINTPFATIPRALQLVGVTNAVNANIRLAPGTFDAPDYIIHNNWVTYYGHETDLETVTQTGAAVQANEVALILDVTGIVSGGAIVDDLRGVLIDWTSGAGQLVARRGWIRHNDVTGTTAPGVTRLTVSQDDANVLRVPVNGNRLKLVQLDSTVRLTQFFHVFQNSVQMNLRSLVVSEAIAGSVCFPLDTDKIGCRDARFNIGRIQVGRGGGLELFNCYGAFTGNANRGILSVRRIGDLQMLRGTVIDCDLRATSNNNRFMEIENAGKMSFDGNVIFVGLNTRGLQWDGADIASSGVITSHFSFVFDACDAGVRINTQTSGLAGWYQLPNLHGTVASIYGVTAIEGAYVELGPSSNLTTGSVANAVSADGGVSATAQNQDTTYIEGGSPVAQGFDTRLVYASGVSVATPITANHTAGAFERVLYNPSGGTFQIDAPSSPLKYDRFAVKNIGTSATTVTISGNLNNIEDPGTPGTYAASFSLGGAGIVHEWEFDGTVWIMVI